MAGAGFGFGSGIGQGMQNVQRARQFQTAMGAFSGGQVNIDALRGIYDPTIQKMAWQMLVQRKGGQYGPLQFARPGSGLPEGTGYQIGPKGGMNILHRPEQGTTLTQEQQVEADLIEAGIKPRAAGPPSAKERIAQRSLDRLVEIEAIPEEKRTKTERAAREKILYGRPLVEIDFGERAVTNTLALRKEFQADRRVKNYQIIDRSEKALRAALEQSRIPGKSRIASDQALGVMFQKMLDPDSVVRESEYARTPEGAAIMSRLKNWIPKLLKGGLAIGDKDRQAIVDMAQKLLDESKRTFNQAYDEFATTAEEFDFNKKALFGGVKKFDMPTFTSEQVEAELKRRGVQ